MDIASLVGILLAFGIIGSAIGMGGPFIIFVNVPSILVVVGGTLGATLMRVTLADFLGSFKVGMKGFIYKMDKPSNLIEEAVEMANISRKEGLLALEGREISNSFLEKGIGLCIDGHSPEIVNNLLSKDIDLTIKRHAKGADMFKACIERSNREIIPAPLSLYIHIPYCDTICYYCACNKIITKNHSVSAEYIDLLDAEMQMIASLLDSDRELEQLHLGGGTPTFLNDDEMIDLIRRIEDNFTFAENCEMSIEIDPRKVSNETLELLTNIGFNRISRRTSTQV